MSITLSGSGLHHRLV
ncbi:hypothetical protein CISIN_1g0154371mg, partial [Citrus sinensis]